MKIECDKCGAKYSIADDKVRGKTFKIRCKKCSNVIIVRDKAGGGDAADGEPPADEPGWHLAIGGETVGPLSEQEVRDRYAAGEIDKETSVWQEGFEDWLPLGDVQTFSDLPSRSPAVAAPAPDPFAASGEDDYSRGSQAHEPEPARPAVAATPVASSPVASSSPAKSGGGGESPRVSALTGARNENSVLFSLDSLSSAVMGGAKPGGGGGGGGGGGSVSSFSSPSPSSSHTPSATGNSEGSGLIDIRSMGAMLGGGGGGGGGGADEDRDDSMLPSFGGTGFGGLSAAPLLTAQPAASAPEPVIAEPQRQSQAPLYIIIGILVLAMGGLGFYVATREPPPPPQPQIVYQSLPVPPDKDEKDEEDRKKKAAKDEEGEEEGEDAADAGDTKTTDDKGGKTTTPKKGDKKGAVKTTDKKGTETKTDGPGETKTEPKTEPKKQEDSTPSVECILDPSKCKKSGGGGGGGDSKPPPDKNLPEKLELEDIKAGTASSKASAESKCKGQAKGGEKVKIKLSINGPAGTVISSTVAEDGGNAGLASCVAAELKKSTFKKVQKEQIGTQISVSF